MFNVISSFSGCGGSSLGYILAGGKILLAIEYDDNAYKNYKLNFPNTPIYYGDIKKISIDEIFDITNLKKFELDILDGSPPCQGFSTAGKRNFNDNRNQLFIEYCRLLEGLQPKIFIMENVAGLIKGNMKFIFSEIISSLKNCGYNVKAKLMNCKFYDVPQSRERMIFIGIRNDLNKQPIFPIPNNNIINLKNALKNCPEGIRKKCNNLEIIKLTKQGESPSKHHPKKSLFNTYRLSWNQPSHTVTKTAGNLIHPDLNETLSIEELKRIHTFPDDFKLIGSFNEKWARIGNSVPPNFMKKISSNIYENILK
jgi:DNA (cytosine-5)-methyltransferase 1